MQDKNDRKHDFRYYARAAKTSATANVRSKAFSDENNPAPLVALAKEFDGKLHQKLLTRNAAQRDLDTYLIEAFKESEGDGTANRG